MLISGAFSSNNRIEKMLRVAFSVVLLLTFASLSPSSAATLDDQLKEDFDAFIENILTCRDIVGMNLAVVYKGETLYTQVGFSGASLSLSISI